MHNHIGIHVFEERIRLVRHRNPERVADAGSLAKVPASFSGAGVDGAHDFYLRAIENATNDFRADGAYAVVDSTDLVLLHVGFQVAERSRQPGQPFVGVAVFASAHLDLRRPLSSKQRDMTIGRSKVCRTQRSRARGG